MNYKFKTVESKNSFDLFQNKHFCSLGSTAPTTEGSDPQGSSGDPDVVIPPKK